MCMCVCTRMSVFSLYICVEWDRRYLKELQFYIFLDSKGINGSGMTVNKFKELCHFVWECAI